MAVTEAPARPAENRRPKPRRDRTSGLWPALAAPGIIWLLVCFIAPLYVVLCIVFGEQDPDFPHLDPGVEPAAVEPRAVQLRAHPHRGRDGVYGPALIRTALYIVVASLLCLAIAFPVSYYVARLSSPAGDCCSRC